MRLRSHRGDRVHGEQHAADQRIRVATHQADGVPRFGPAGLVAGVERSDDVAQAGHGGHRSPAVTRRGPTRWPVRGWRGGCMHAARWRGGCSGVAATAPLLPLRALRCSWSTWGRGFAVDPAGLEPAAYAL